MSMVGRKVVVFAVVALACGVLTAVANADGNGTQTTQFKATYIDGFGHPSTCSGVNQVKKDGSVYDSETCTLTGDTSGFVAGTFSSSATTGAGCGLITPNPPGFGTTGGVIWLSDFPGLNGKCAVSWTETLSPNADGSWKLDFKGKY